MITIMAIVRTNYANHATQQSKTEIMQHATVLGVDAAFAFTTVLLIIGFVLTLMIRTQKITLRHNTSTLTLLRARKGVFILIFNYLYKQQSLYLRTIAPLWKGMILTPYNIMFSL